METRITRMFGIKHPLVLSGMSWVSEPELVAAVAEAGGLAILATGSLSPESTRKSIARIRELTDKPFGANCVLYFPGGKENARVLLEEKVPIINYAMGKGDWIVKEAHQYGGKVIGTVTNIKHALQAESYGTDALLITGHEAAGHGGDITTLVLLPAIASAVKIPIIAAGGFADGRGVAAALALGADAVAMGTRFMATAESPVHKACKNAAISKGMEDTIHTTRFDGQPCRILVSPGSKRAVRRGLDLISAFFNSREIARMLGVNWLKLAAGITFSGWKTLRHMAYLANAFAAFRKATQLGDLNRGVLPLGQVAELVKDAPPVAELMERIVKEAQEAQERAAAAFR